MAFHDRGDLTSGGDITTIDIASGKSKECPPPMTVNDTAVFKNGQPLNMHDTK